jgi:hypothetical protein
LSNRSEGHIYDLDRLPMGWSQADLQRPSALDRLRAAWLKAKTSNETDPESQRTKLWLALTLAQALFRSNNRDRGRAVLESALDILPDSGHRHIICCHLALQASKGRDLSSAECWLAQCDPVSEILELDGIYRQAMAQLKTVRGEYQTVLHVVGSRDEDIPIHPAYAVTCSALRIHALESLGHYVEAFREFAAICAKNGKAPLVAKLESEQLACRTLRQCKREELDALIQKRQDTPTGLRALEAPIRYLPALAFALLIVVSIPRCIFDFDPFVGVHGYLLCPHRCEHCKGPFRIYTVWDHDGGEHSTSGAEYYCQSPNNHLATMTQEEMASNLATLKPYELSLAPTAATYLTFLFLCLPFALFAGMRRHLRAVRARDVLDEQIGEVSHALGQMTSHEPSSTLPMLRPSTLRAFAPAIGSAVAAVLVIVIELLVRR